MGVCTKYCDPCVYRKSITGGWCPYCDYLCMTGKQRPCPAGDGCTVRVTRRVYRKRVLTEEEKAQREERKRERNREAARRSYHKHREEHLARKKQYQKEHREELNAYSREYRKRRKEREMVSDRSICGVILCKDCKHLMFSDFYGECKQGNLGIVKPDDFCSYGERKDGDGNG